MLFFSVVYAFFSAAAIRALSPSVSVCLASSPLLFSPLLSVSSPLSSPLVLSSSPLLYQLPFSSRLSCGPSRKLFRRRRRCRWRRGADRSLRTAFASSILQQSYSYLFLSALFYTLLAPLRMMHVRVVRSASGGWDVIVVSGQASRALLSRADATSPLLHASAVPAALVRPADLLPRQSPAH